LLVDEAHHVRLAAWGHRGETFPQQLGKTFFITVHPDHIASQVLASVEIVIAVGWEPGRSLQAFATAAGTTLSCLEFHHGGDKAVVWFVKKKEEPFPVTIIPGDWNGFGTTVNMLKVLMKRLGSSISNGGLFALVQRSNKGFLSGYPGRANRREKGFSASRNPPPDSPSH
jgi:hypothetical protein